MEHVGYYFSIFRRRLPYFLIIATIASAVSVTVAFTLPPAYVSKMILLVESPQIPKDLAASTVQAPAYEQLQILQQRLLTRSNLLEIARKHNVMPNQHKMNPDEIVRSMRSRTRIRTRGRSRQEAPLMTISFEAPRARTASQVLNEYLILIQRQDTRFRKGRSGETLEFFGQEVKRLAQERDLQTTKILEFKKENAKTLPESLQLRLKRQSDLQSDVGRANQQIADLENQRDHLIKLHTLTGGDASSGKALSNNIARLAELREQLENALSVYSRENPRVKLLESRIASLEERVQIEPAASEGESETAVEEENFPPVLVIQLSEIDARIEVLERQKEAILANLSDLAVTIDKTPETAVELEGLERRYETLQKQYQTAEQRLALAQTGDRIETRSRGQRIAVVEQPATPSEPTKPDRMKIAIGGSGLGVLAGLGLIVLLEFLNTTARRPEDIVSKLGITPLTTIPYIQTKSQRLWRRSGKLLVVLVILIGVPIAVFALHTFYLPLDLLAEKVMNKLGVRW